MARGQGEAGITFRYLGLFAVILLLTASITALVVHRVASLPSGLFVLPPDQSFGTVKDEERVRAKYAICNNTDHAVRLVKTSVSCGCLQLRLSKNRIVPRGRATAELRVDISRRVGRQMFEALVVTDDKQTPSLLLRLTGTVICSKSLELPYSLGRFPPNFPIRENVRLPRGSDAAAKIVDASVQGFDGWSAEARPDSDQAGAFLVVVSGRAPSVAGPFRCELCLKATGAAWEHARVTLAGAVVSRWRFPKAVYFGFVRPGCTVERSIDIVDITAASGGSPCTQAPRLASEISALRTRLTPKANDAYSLVLDLTNTGAEHGPFSRTLKLELPVEATARSSTATEAGTIEMHAFFEQ